jgi:hypothetical protein
MGPHEAACEGRRALVRIPHVLKLDKSWPPLHFGAALVSPHAPQNDQKHGQGVYVFENGELWAGPFARDRPLLAPADTFAPASNGVVLQVGHCSVIVLCNCHDFCMSFAVSTRPAHVRTYTLPHRVQMGDHHVLCVSPHVCRSATCWRRRSGQRRAGAPSQNYCCATTRVRGAD